MNQNFMTLHIVEPRDLSQSHPVTRIVKSWKISWGGHVATLLTESKHTEF
jgi:hypothetical protein